IDYDATFSIEPSDVYRALFFGLGSDGTVGANKNTCKIIGDTGAYAQGYFVYDSKKAGAVTVSHLRFGPRPIRSTYLIQSANFVACHQRSLFDRFDVVKELAQGGTFLFNGDESLLPSKVREQLIAKNAKVYAIDASRVAREAGMGARINTIMQVCFFSLANVMPVDKAIEAIRKSIEKTYAKKGDKVVELNLRAVDAALENLHPVILSPAEGEGSQATVAARATTLRTIDEIIAGRGDDLPVSAMPCDGTFPTATAQYEKRNLALEIPVWDAEACIQCGKCAVVCPHATIRIKVYDEAKKADAPPTFKSLKPVHKDWAGLAYSIQVAPEDCTGCAICVDVCPAKSKKVPDRKALYMQPQPPLREQEAANWDYFLSLPETDRLKLNPSQIRHQALQQPLFEFSGACSGCGETPYLKMMTQLFGDRVLVANATGCSSIYGGNLPTTPWTINADGRGPAWSNSLFEDNAEFGLGLRLAADAHLRQARQRLTELRDVLGADLVDA
ncbi:MAG TPA: 2-oxoacid:acceptor oxidoreductase family protein, partial [Thermoanaerobaculia bacterium]|nr:2-oxoacid:acceptor oxidoreductase family protein [Thermoanaerobaculia bacterium]